MPARQSSKVSNAKGRKAKWRFPDSNHGLFQDYNDNQAAHFSRTPINHLVRECIQNSLDARASTDHAVESSFDEVLIPTSILDVGSYTEHLNSCIAEADRRNNADAVWDYQRALEHLQHETVRALRIKDTATTGLVGPNWEALVSSQGAVHKNANNGTPGGSFGVGKNVVFLFSSIHAVVYSTRYANRQEGAVQKAVGRSQLMSHPKADHSDYHQPSGWLEIEQSPLTGRNIPSPFRLSEPGTAVFILGWQPDGDDWPQQVALYAAQNFFSAIHRRLLRVTVSDNAANCASVDHRTIESTLSMSGDLEGQRFLNYYQTVCSQTEIQLQASAKTRFNARIQQGAGPNRAALVTGNGMFVTDATSLAYNPLHIRHKSTWPDHAMVIAPADDATDRWLRNMENPSHDSVSPDQLKTAGHRREASEAFLTARRQLRDILDDMAGLAAPGESINVAELADILPEEEQQRSHDEFEVSVHLAQTTQTQLTDSNPEPGSLTNTAGETSNQDNEVTGETTGPTDFPKPGDNPNVDSPGQLENPARPTSIAHHRIIAADTHSAHVFITPANQSPVRIAVKPAGAEFRRESPIIITSARLISDDGATIPGNFPTDAFQFTPPPGERAHLELTFQSSIESLALKLA